jgi:hypothetical protein
MTAQEYEFYELGPVWHLCSSGVHQCVIFRTEEEFIYGMNMVALSAVHFIDEMKMLTFEVMSNHFHFVVACEEEVMDRFVNFLTKKLHRYLLLQERVSDLKGFTFKHFRISDLRHLQTVICYANRNGYLVDKNSTPFTYPWGANSYFFNPIRELETSIDISDLSISKIRSIFRCREYRLHRNLKFLPDLGYFSPASFCHIKLAENLFRDARHYFSCISRQVESYSQIARELGDSVFYTDEEMYTAIYSHCAKRYDVKNPSLLGRNEKLDVAKIMKYDYNASNAQIMRILKIDERILDELFPITTTRKKK